MVIGLFVVVMALVVACSSSQNGQPTIAPPPKVHVADNPYTGQTLGDPRFEPLPGATAHFGRLGGSVYQIEVPQNWNKRLVLYVRGSDATFQPVLEVQAPLDRVDLINQGFAWAASSLSRSDFLFGTGADETAALWDRFVEEFGRPSHSYVIGGSAGGASGLISANRYANRFDGVLVLCPAPGTRAHITYITDTVVAAFFATGVNQSDFDRAKAPDLVDHVVLPALADESIHKRFSALWLDLTGGARPFAEEGLKVQERYLLRFGAKLIAYGTVDNTARTYRSGATGAELTQFNESAVRISSPKINYAAEEVNNVSGAIEMPVLALYNSGDALVPPSSARYVREVVDAAEKSDLLVQRFIDSPNHCGYSPGDINRAFDDLVAWVEHSERPAP